LVVGRLGVGELFENCFSNKKQKASQTNAPNLDDTRELDTLCIALARVRVHKVAENEDDFQDTVKVVARLESTSSLVDNVDRLFFFFSVSDQPTLVGGSDIPV